jgi:hypothetical protein
VIAPEVGGVLAEVGRIGPRGAEIDHVADRGVAGDGLAAAAGALAGEGVPRNRAEAAFAAGWGEFGGCGRGGRGSDASMLMHRTFLARAGTGDAARSGFAVNADSVFDSS